MIVIKVEMWPYGQRDQAYEIGRAYIYNDGSELSGNKGNYGVHLAKPHYLDEARGNFASKYIAKRGYVRGFPRGPANLWPLILAALKSCKLRRATAQPISHGILPAKEDVT